MCYVALCARLPSDEKMKFHSLLVLTILVLYLACFYKPSASSITATYRVFKENTETVLRDQSAELLRSADSEYIINEALKLGTTTKPILIESGTYQIDSNIVMQSNTILALAKGVKIEATYTPTTMKGIVDFRGVTNAHFVTETEPASESAYPRVLGKGTSNNELGVLMTSRSGIRTTYCSVGKIAFSNIGGDGICLLYADNNELNGTYVYGFAKASGSNHHGLAIRVGSYNKLINCHIDAEKGQYANHPLYLGGEGPVTYNEVIGGIYENSALSHASYWCAEPNGGIIDHNVCVGTIFRGCRGEGYATGLKLNAATNSRIGIDSDGTIDPVMLIDCQVGLAMGDGSGVTGNHGNIIYAIIKNCRKGSEWFTQASNNVENNEIHLDVDGNDPNYPMTGVGGSYAFDFGGFHAISGSSYVQNNTIYLKARNCINGVVFAGWDTAMSATQEGRYNTFILDVEATEYAIYWQTGSAGFGRWNKFYGYWYGGVANVSSDIGQAVIDTNYFYPGQYPNGGDGRNVGLTDLTVLLIGAITLVGAGVMAYRRALGTQKRRVIRRKA